MKIMGFQLPTSTSEFPGFQGPINSSVYYQASIFTRFLVSQSLKVTMMCAADSSISDFGPPICQADIEGSTGIHWFYETSTFPEI